MTCRQRRPSVYSGPSTKTQLMTVKLDDLQVSFKDEGYRYGKTYLCVCLPTFQLLDMKKIKRNIAETITGPTKQEKETNVVMSALV